MSVDSVMERCHAPEKEEKTYTLNMNTVELLPPRYERRGNGRVTFGRSVERDRFGNIVEFKEIECGTITNFYGEEPKPGMLDKVLSLFA